MTTVKTADEMARTYAGIATALGAPADEAEVFARTLVRADLRGLYTQGAALVPYLVGQIEERLMRWGAPFRIVREEASIASVDGGFGVGSVVSTRAMDLAIEKASRTGIGAVWVANGGDFAMASNYALQALEHGMVGVAMRNGTPRVAPWGGRDAFFGTDPLAVAVPSDDEAPVVMDMAAGSFSVGQVVMAARDDRKLPSAHVVDAEGRYTDDATKIIDDPQDRESSFSGAIVSLGHKGYIWLLIVELLTALLPGTNTSNRNDYEPTGDAPWNEGSFFMAIDVAKLQPVADFARGVDGFVRALGAVRPAEGFERVIVPGQPEAEKEARYAREGIPVRDEDWERVQAIAGRLGVDA